MWRGGGSPPTLNKTSGVSQREIEQETTGGGSLPDVFGTCCWLGKSRGWGENGGLERTMPSASHWAKTSLRLMQPGTVFSVWVHGKVPV